jgi:hypothetical protein
MGVLISKHFKNVMKLQDCSVSDTDHIVPKSSGEAVKKIQEALAKIESISFPSNEADGKDYGTATINAVEAFKKKRGILNYENKVDNIVGQKTIRQLDKEMNDLEPDLPPSPRPPVPPQASSAGIQIAFGLRIAPAYYQHCGLETIGGGQVPTSNIKTHFTFEDMIDTLLSRSERHQVIVNHGSPERGLIIKLCRETGFTDTGTVITYLALLTDSAEKGTLGSDGSKRMLHTLASRANITTSVANRIILKLLLLRHKRFIYHFRACNMQEETVTEYKLAFGAMGISYHSCRLVFVEVVPQQTKPGDRVISLMTKHPSTKTQRYRGLADPMGLLEPILIGIKDIDGHVRLETYTVSERRSTREIAGWAEFLIRQWDIQDPKSFVMPVMWENGETTFHCPLEPVWREKLKYV